MLFIDFLHCCQCDDNFFVCKRFKFNFNLLDISLKNVLRFFTATEIPPPLGCNPTPSLRFNPSIVYRSYCLALELTLPTKYYDDAESFNEKVMYGVRNHGGFGFARNFLLLRIMINYHLICLYILKSQFVTSMTNLSQITYPQIKSVFLSMTVFYISSN